MQHYLDNAVAALSGHLEAIVEIIDDGRCESAIERGLLVAIVGRWFVNRRIRFDRGPGSLRFDNTSIETDFIQRVYLQHEVGSYRLDFSMHLEIIEDGRKLSQWFAIECDGHDFHERTKEQARRDKARDRYLTGAGYKIIRFAGSEIYRDATKCAEEIDSICWKAVSAFRDGEK